jgi:hypothetical protein
VDVPNIITYIVLDRESFVSWLATQERVWEQSSVFLLFFPHVFSRTGLAEPNGSGSKLNTFTD